MILRRKALQAAMQHRRLTGWLAAALWSGLAGLPLGAQQRSVDPVAAPSKAAVSLAAPSSPTVAPSNFKDPRFKLSMEIPAGWSLATKDHVVSTFRLDARSAPRSTQLRAVANIAFNPFPDSTFSGAFVYFSVTPHATDATCSRQVNTRSLPTGSARVLALAHKPVADPIRIDGLDFNHAHDQHGNICVQARDDVYTAYRHGACYRFDLAMNNFCGGEVSGVRDMTDQQIEDIRQRMQNILTTVHFNQK